MRYKILLTILTAGALLGLSACQESTTVSNRIAVALHANYIHPDRTDFQFPNTSTSVSFTVTSQETPWRIDDAPTWINISPKSGSATTTVSVTTEEYAWADPRVGIFTLYSDSSDWSYSKQMTVTQSGATPYVNLEKNYFSFDGAAHSETVAASSNFDWQVANNYGWINVDFDGSRMTLSVTANDTGEIRSGEVNIKYNSNTQGTITVSQVPAEVSLKTDPLNFPIGAGSYKLTVESQAAWRTDAPSWVDVNPSAGDPGKTEVTISVSPNPYDGERNGSVYFIFSSSRMQFAEIPVHQDGVILELVEGNDYFYDMTSLSRDFTAHVHSNTDWSIRNDCYFMSVSPMSGSGDATLSLSLNDNGSFNWRNGWIYLTRPATGYEQVYSVQQKPRSYELNTTYMDCNDLAQDLYLDVKTEGGWSLVPVEGTTFYSANPLSSQGDTRVTISVQENTDTWGRSGYMDFYLLGMEGYENGMAWVNNVSIYQNGWQDKYQRVQQAVELAARGGSMTVDIASNDAWTAAFSSGASWIRMDGETSGKGAGGFSVAFDPNQTIDARSVKVLITFEHLDPVEMTLTQLGKAIRLSSDALYFFAKGGSCTVVVDADGTYSVTKASGDWFTVTPDETNNTFTVTAEANPADADRTGSIVLSLTDLASGSYSITLPVTQTTAAGFTRGGWQEDRDLNIGNAGGFSFKITGYSEDQDWNGGRHASVGGEGYDDDENWN